MRYRISSLLLLILAASIVAGLWGRHLHREAQIERGVEMLASFDIWRFNGDADPRELIRIVNHFHNLGHHDSIDGIRRFTRDNDDWFDRAEKLELIVPLLFFPKNSNSQLPYWHYGNSNNSSGITLEKTIHELHGIPFETEFRGRVGSGSRILSLYLIGWAENDAEFRDSPLTPGDNPFACFDTMVSTVLNLDYFVPYRKEHTDTEARITHMLRCQLYYLVHESIDDPGFPAPRNWIPTDDNWIKLISYFRTYDLKWNPNTQSYTRLPKGAG